MTVYNTESWKQIQIEQNRRSLASIVANRRRHELQQNLAEFFAQHEARQAQQQQQA